MKAVFADTFYWIALLNRNDAHFRQEGFVVLCEPTS
jgi:hypothetical protein